MISLPAAWSIDAGPNGIEIALVGQRSTERWQLPKGTPEPPGIARTGGHTGGARGTGLFVRLVCPLDEIQYWFAINGQRHFKTVAFYLMEAIGGDTSLHDGEYDEAAWFPLSEALGRLAFANEVEIVLMAAHRLNAAPADSGIADPGA